MSRNHFTPGGESKTTSTACEARARSAQKVSSAETVENASVSEAMEHLLAGLPGAVPAETRRAARADLPPMYEDKHGIPVIYDSAVQTSKHTGTDDVSLLSHELLSPLTLIKGYTSTLLQLKEVITEEQKLKYLQGIETATNRVIRLLENYRDLARLEEKDTFDLEPADLPHLLRQTVVEIQSQTTKHVLRLQTSTTLPQVNIDAAKLHQVMTNLLVNAVKYSPEGGDIEASVKLIHSEIEMREIFGDLPVIRVPCVVVSVADEGIGIPEADLGKIFQRLYRANHKIIKVTPGAGLGLYICRLIVEGHGGCIWARNKVEGGSVFSFSLPVDGAASVIQSL